jgi:hypothetical protein
MGQQWSSMGDQSKEKFVQMAEADKARYENDLKRYRPTPAWLEAKEYLDARRANAQAVADAEERKKNGPHPGDAKAAARAATQERNKEKKAEKLMAQQRKDSAAHKIAVAHYQKASKLRAKFESDEAKAKVKLLLLEAKLKTSAAEMEKAGVKKRKNAAVYDPAPIGRPAPPAAQLLNLGGDF